MIEEACVAIETVTAREQRNRVRKYAHRNRMRYIDGLLNELEMLNLADRRRLPPQLAGAVDKLVAEHEVPDLESGPPDSVPAAMDALYVIQDCLMENPVGDE
ncbi:MAG: hypothetical protein M3024_07415 [Candidatus Dormibacteraeota bacterium]|nr:hypothetical protein [Candidatus Dormibacteraeota bacterium]